ncbi:MAG: Rieske (2Fe-2S) protein [Dethiobacter sp.]|jgi:3-phenylpropionate/trans-cinnamate dioxygenase ferredoxin subunit|nr:Rieske (2Fe-2S) protein [Dethiobacter sp.]MBS3989814.1 Rieske (2Fe-2S) protein [Dethiobacter sp.]
MENWITVMSANKLTEGSISKNKLGNNSFLLIKREDAIYALLNQCPHLGCAMHNGELSGYILKCPCHDWLFDIRTGQFITAPEIKIPTFPVKVEAGEIMVNMGGEN